MGILIVHPESEEKMAALKAFMKAFKISFEEEQQSLYDSAFVEKISHSNEDFKRVNLKP